MFTIFLLQAIVWVSIALADNCVGGVDCLETAGYNMGLGVLGGALAAGAAALGGNGSAEEEDQPKPEEIRVDAKGEDIFGTVDPPENTTEPKTVENGRRESGRPSILDEPLGEDRDTGE
jgi:hypothetical protein